jgi:NADH-quinone oxidoreductase subunit G
MSRCIQCTRCVRFGQEIAGVMELGLAGRGEHAEIVSFVGRAVESELSGNMIDLCPVGALTSEPFRYSARTWELSRRKSVSPHDALGSNLVVQVKQNRVMRVLPLENENINECWLSDRDRFSYEGLNSPDRLKRPLVRAPEGWLEADWQDALHYVAEHLKDKDVGILASPHSTLEELFLAGKLAQGRGAADFRLRHADFSGDGKRAGIPWLGMPIAELEKLDTVLVIGSFLRKESPLIAHRLRQAAKRRAQIHMLHSVDDDWLMPIASKTVVAPSALVDAIAGFQGALAKGKNVAVLIGAWAEQHPQAAAIHAAAQALGFRVGFIGEAANSVGGYLAGLPAGNATEVLKKRAIILLGAEPLDCADPQATLAALTGAEFVVQLSSWKTGLDYAHAVLPIAPFSETAGTFVNIEGRAQSFYSNVNPLGETRPGWKVLRVLGSLLERPGFDFDTIDEVRNACLAGKDLNALLSNRIGAVSAPRMAPGIQRIADVPMYFADPLVRRSPPLQKTKEAQPPRAWMNSRTLQKAGVAAGQPVMVNEARVAAALDERVPDDCVRLAGAHPSTVGAGPMFGTVRIEKAAVERAA